ncbi:hypothetical protein Tco_0637464 [Tanacetum coccineum]
MKHLSLKLREEKSKKVDLCLSLESGRTRGSGEDNSVILMMNLKLSLYCPSKRGQREGNAPMIEEESATNSKIEKDNGEELQIKGLQRTKGGEKKGAKARKGLNVDKRCIEIRNDFKEESVEAMNTTSL